MENVTKINEKFNVDSLTIEELEEINGGEVVITTALIIKGIGLLATGWKVGRYLKEHF
ncbi:hypothetical protein [Streptococcus suis]|uniref:hypothetical protein n=1 Tax=Streptococcus suis TaxID=1307 RepID=UPI0037564CB4